MIPSRTVLVSLGRLGDVMTILPYAYHLSQQPGPKPIMLVAEKYASALDGVSYVEKMVYPGEYDDISGAVAWLKKNRKRDRIVLCQTYKNPVDSRRLTPNFEMENWRVAGALDQFGQHPLVFDKRDKAREAETFAGMATDKPVILVTTKANSAPFDKGLELLSALQSAFGDTHQVLDLDAVRVDRIYDLLGAYDRAVCLVAVDSAPLHLANAHPIPLVALIGDDPWVHSVEPATTVKAIRYDEARVSFDGVIESVRRVIDAGYRRRFITHVWDSHGQSARHLAARSTWEAAYGDESVIEVSGTEWGTDSREIGDVRALPKLKDILRHGLEQAKTDEDVIVFTNSDVGLTANCFEDFKRQASIWGAFSVRRVERGLAYVHPGREVFGFRADWLRKHLDAIPEFWCAAPCWDMVLAALIRKQRGIVSNKLNMAHDFAPCELPAGCVDHEPHVSQWAGDSNRDNQPANLWNLRLAREWLAKECPTLRL